MPEIPELGRLSKKTTSSRPKIRIDRIFSEASGCYLSRFVVVLVGWLVLYSLSCALISATVLKLCPSWPALKCKPLITTSHVEFSLVFTAKLSDQRSLFQPWVLWPVSAFRAAFNFSCNFLSKICNLLIPNCFEADHMVKKKAQGGTWTIKRAIWRRQRKWRVIVQLYISWKPWVTNFAFIPLQGQTFSSKSTHLSQHGTK